jgi:uncharacterized protein YpmS
MQPAEKRYWNRLYFIVLALLVAQIIFYYLITKHFQ